MAYSVQYSAVQYIWEMRKEISVSNHIASFSLCHTHQPTPPYTHTHTRTHAHAHTHTHTHTHKHTHTQSHAHSVMHARMHTYAHSCMHTQTHHVSCRTLQIWHPLQPPWGHTTVPAPIHLPLHTPTQPPRQAYSVTIWMDPKAQGQGQHHSRAEELHMHRSAHTAALNADIQWILSTEDTDLISLVAFSLKGFIQRIVSV